MDAVPSPFAGVDTFEKLMKQSDFKDYLTRNLDSEYLISSILADDIDGDAFVEGIEQYRSLTPTLRESLINRINNFELATTAGIDVSIPLIYLVTNIPDVTHLIHHIHNLFCFVVCYQPKHIHRYVSPIP